MLAAGVASVGVIAPRLRLWFRETPISWAISFFVPTTAPSAE